MAEQRRKLRLGELMVQQGLISQDQLRIALIEQEQNDIPLGRQLVRLGFVSETMVRDLVAHTIGQESIDLTAVVADGDALKMVPEDFSRRYHFCDQLKPVLAAEAQLEEYIDQFYDYELSVDGILREIETGEIDYQSLQTESDEYTQPVVRLVGALLMDAVKKGASDIHFEPEFAFLRIRYRIDGVLQQVRSLHKSYWPGVSVRLKVVSGMDIAETRSAQDGRINMNLCGRPIDFRDPDIILVGEVRDEDTATMAFRAAMTGHQVFTTLHTNSALGLKRTEAAEVFKPKGCQKCNLTGYRGRMAIIELLRIDDEMDALIARRAHLDELRTMALDKGFSTLAEDGLTVATFDYRAIDQAGLQAKGQMDALNDADLEIRLERMGLTAGIWHGAKLQSYQVFKNQDEDHTAFSEYMAKHASINVYLIVDAIEEDYKLEALPHTTGNARREIIEPVIIGRQSYLHNGRLRISRLTPMADIKPEQLSYFYLVEIEKTRLYLLSQRLITAETGLQMVLPAYDETSDKIASSISQDQGIECKTVDILAYAKNNHIKQAAVKKHPELLHMQLLANGHVPDNLAPPELTKTYNINKLCRSIYIGASLIAMAGFLLAAVYLVQGYQLNNKAERKEN
ncbi:Type 4 fimbrial assembly protein PilB [Nymphon striatum]|nr:Type 4 fimbrial assembly protein PilB [Nymphon striatum]